MKKSLKFLPRKPLAVALAGLVGFEAQVALANDSFVIEELVVTAQKRAESVQDVPVAITAFDESSMKDASIEAVADVIMYAPGLSGSSTGIGTNDWAIRGISSSDFTSGSEPSVGTYIDDAYIGRNILANGAFFDVERVEVVRGPQGTLFGRNAVAGAIAIHTVRPNLDSNSMTLSGSIGNEGQRRYEFAGNLVASENVAIRLAAFSDEMEGGQKNTFTNKENSTEETGGRLSILWQISNDLEAQLTHQVTDSEYVYSFVDEAVAGEELPDKYAADMPNREYSRTSGTTLRLAWDINDELTLTSISDFRDYQQGLDQDLDGSIAPFISEAELFIGANTDPTLGFGYNTRQDQESYSQEFRLNASTGDFDWFVGASWFKESLAENAQLTNNIAGTTTVVNLGDSGSSKGETQSQAIYGDIAWNVNEKWKLTGGVRYTRDEREACSITSGIALNDTNGAEVCGDEDWSDVSPRLVADYQASNDLLFYASVAKGYKAGAVDSAVAPGNPPIIFGGGFTLGEKLSFVDPEQLTAWELGMKSTLLEGSMQLNLAVYHNDYEDLQVLDIRNLVQRLESIDEITTQGAELEVTYLPPVEGLQLSFNYAYLHTEVEKGELNGENIKGNHLKQAPRHTASLGVNYDMALGDGALSFFGAYNWQDDVYHDLQNSDEVAQDNYGLVSAGVRFEPASGAWDVALQGSNLLDKDHGVSYWNNFGRASVKGDGRMINLAFNYYLGD